MKKRSVGVTVFAVLFVIIGLAGFVSSVQSLLIDKETFDAKKIFFNLTENYPPDIKALFTDNALVDNLLACYEEIALSSELALTNWINAAVCFLVVVFGVGIWLLRDWARKGAIALFLVSVPIGLYSGFVLGSRIKIALENNNLPMFLYVFDRIPIVLFFTAINFILLFVNAAVLCAYFHRPEIRRQFEGDDKKGQGVGD